MNNEKKIKNKPKSSKQKFNIFDFACILTDCKKTILKKPVEVVN